MSDDRPLWDRILEMANEVCDRPERGRILVDEREASKAWIDAIAEECRQRVPDGRISKAAFFKSLLEGECENTVYGVRTVASPCIHEGLRYVPDRDPLIFGASA